MKEGARTYWHLEWDHKVKIRIYVIVPTEARKPKGQYEVSSQLTQKLRQARKNCIIYQKAIHIQSPTQITKFLIKQSYFIWRKLGSVPRYPRFEETKVTNITTSNVQNSFLVSTKEKNKFLDLSKCHSLHTRNKSAIFLCKPKIKFCRFIKKILTNGQ